MGWKFDQLPKTPYRFSDDTYTRLADVAREVSHLTGRIIEPENLYLILDTEFLRHHIVKKRGRYHGHYGLDALDQYGYERLVSAVLKAKQAIPAIVSPVCLDIQSRPIGVGITHAGGNMKPVVFRLSAVALELQKKTHLLIEPHELYGLLDFADLEITLCKGRPNALYGTQGITAEAFAQLLEIPAETLIAELLGDGAK